MAGDELEIPLVGLRGPHRKRHTIRLLDAKIFPVVRSPLTPGEEVCSQAALWRSPLHEAALFSLAGDPPRRGRP